MKLQNLLLNFFALCFFIIPTVHTYSTINESNSFEQLTASSIPVCNQAIPLVVVLMVKNEEHVIVPTLKPYVEGHIKHLLVFDTGSTDRTIENTQTFFKENNLEHAYVVQEPFIPSQDCPDFPFDIFRNKALEIAEEKFPHASFILMPDAEWYIKNIPALLDFCTQKAHSNCDLYLLRAQYSLTHFYTPRLIRSRANIRFGGDIHEAPISMSEDKVPQSIYFELNNSLQGIEKSRKRWDRDKIKLLKRYEKNPQDPRTLFYLAQTCECLNDFENAQKYYALRINTIGWDEENYMAMYRLALVTEKLAEKEALADYTLALSYYDKAYSMRPQRAEPLIRAGQIYWKMHQFTSAFVFAKRAIELPYPKTESLILEDYSYDFERYELMSKAAWYVKEYKLGEEATRKVLEKTPFEPQFYRNLALYLENLKFQVR